MNAAEICPRTRLFAGAVLAALVAWAPAVEAGGHLDGGYGVGGYFLDPPLGDSDGEAGPVSEYTSVAIANDGGLYGVGFVSDDLCSVVAVSASGDRIPAWGGSAAGSFACWEQDLRPAIAVQDDGRVIVAYAGGWQQLRLSRWTADGDPDPEFGNAGVVAVDVPFVLFGEPRMQAAPDGSIVVAFGGRAAGSGCPGFSCDDAQARLGALRLTADGSLAAAHFDLPAPDAARESVIIGVAARPDGSVTVVVAGPHACEPSGPCSDAVSLIQLAVDETTSTRIARWGTYYSFPTMLLDGDTVFVAAYNDDDVWLLHRFDLDGDRRGDPVRLASLDGLYALGIGPTGFIYVAGGVGDWAQSGVGVLRSVVRAYRPDGQPDPSFTTAGVDHAVPLDAQELRVAPSGRLTVAALSGGRLGAVRLSLADGNHPGRLGIAQRHVHGETGSLLGRSDGNSTTINQRATRLDFQVDRTGGSEGAVSVAYRIDGNTAAAGAFVPVDGRLDWTPGETASKTVSLTLLAANPVQVGARVELFLSQPTGGATIGARTHAVHVLEASPGRLGFPDFGNDVPAFREGSGGTIVIMRRGGGNGSVSVRLRRVYVSQLGQSASPADLSGPDKVVRTWADGETGAKLYEFDIPDDRIAEPREYLRLELSEATGGAIVDLASLEIAIDDSGNNSSGNPPPAGGSSGGGGALDWLGVLTLALLAVAAGGGRRRLVSRRSAA